MLIPTKKMTKSVLLDKTIINWFYFKFLHKNLSFTPVCAESKEERSKKKKKKTIHVSTLNSLMTISSSFSPR